MAEQNETLKNALQKIKDSVKASLKKKVEDTIQEDEDTVITKEGNELEKHTDLKAKVVKHFQRDEPVITDSFKEKVSNKIDDIRKTIKAEDSTKEETKQPEDLILYGDNKTIHDYSIKTISGDDVITAPTGDFTGSTLSGSLEENNKKMNQLFEFQTEKQKQEENRIFKEDLKAGEYYMLPNGNMVLYDPEEEHTSSWINPLKWTDSTLDYLRDSKRDFLVDLAKYERGELKEQEMLDMYGENLNRARKLDWEVKTDTLPPDYSPSETLAQVLKNKKEGKYKYDYDKLDMDYNGYQAIHSEKDMMGLYRDTGSKIVETTYNELDKSLGGEGDQQKKIEDTQYIATQLLKQTNFTLTYGSYNEFENLMEVLRVTGDHEKYRTIEQFFTNKMNDYVKTAVYAYNNGNDGVDERINNIHFLGEITEKELYDLYKSCNKYEQQLLTDAYTMFGKGATKLNPLEWIATDNLNLQKVIEFITKDIETNGDMNNWEYLYDYARQGVVNTFSSPIRAVETFTDDTANTAFVKRTLKKTEKGEKVYMGTIDNYLDMGALFAKEIVTDPLTLVATPFTAGGSIAAKCFQLLSKTAKTSKVFKAFKQLDKVKFAYDKAKKVTTFTDSILESAGLTRLKGTMSWLFDEVALDVMMGLAQPTEYKGEDAFLDVITGLFSGVIKQREITALLNGKRILGAQESLLRWSLKKAGKSDKEIDAIVMSLGTSGVVKEGDEIINDLNKLVKEFQKKGSGELTEKIFGDMLDTLSKKKLDGYFSNIEKRLSDTYKNIEESAKTVLAVHGDNRVKYVNENGEEKLIWNTKKIKNAREEGIKKYIEGDYRNKISEKDMVRNLIKLGSTTMRDRIIRDYKKSFDQLGLLEKLFFNSTFKRRDKKLHHALGKIIAEGDISFFVYLKDLGLDLKKLNADEIQRAYSRYVTSKKMYDGEISGGKDEAENIKARKRIAQTNKLTAIINKDFSKYPVKTGLDKKTFDAIVNSNLSLAKKQELLTMVNSGMLKDYSLGALELKLNAFKSAESISVLKKLLKDKRYMTIGNQLYSLSITTTKEGKRVADLMIGNKKAGTLEIKKNGVELKDIEGNLIKEKPIFYKESPVNKKSVTITEDNFKSYLKVFGIPVDENKIKKIFNGNDKKSLLDVFAGYGLLKKFSNNGSFGNWLIRYIQDEIERNGKKLTVVHEILQKAEKEMVLVNMFNKKHPNVLTDIELHELARDVLNDPRVVNKENFKAMGLNENDITDIMAERCFEKTGVLYKESTFYRGNGKDKRAERIMNMLYGEQLTKELLGSEAWKLENFKKAQQLLQVDDNELIHLIQMGYGDFVRDAVHSVQVMSIDQASKYKQAYVEFNKKLSELINRIGQLKTGRKQKYKLNYSQWFEMLKKNNNIDPHGTIGELLDELEKIYKKISPDEFEEKIIEERVKQGGNVDNNSPELKQLFKETIFNTVEANEWDAVARYAEQKLPVANVYYYDTKGNLHTLKGKELEAGTKEFNDLVGNLKNAGGATVNGFYHSDCIVFVEGKATLHTVNHEWFHGALELCFTKEERENIKKLFAEVYEKHKDDIEANAVVNGYTDLDVYTKTEEWLAERFGDYATGKMNNPGIGKKKGFDHILGSKLINFFKRLWIRVQMLFHPDIRKKVIDLFDDIYYRRHRLEQDVVKNKVDKTLYQLDGDEQQIANATFTQSGFKQGGTKYYTIDGILFKTNKGKALIEANRDEIISKTKIDSFKQTGNTYPVDPIELHKKIKIDGKKQSFVDFIEGIVKVDFDNFVKEFRNGIENAIQVGVREFSLDGTPIRIKQQSGTTYEIIREGEMGDMPMGTFTFDINRGYQLGKIGRGVYMDMFGDLRTSDESRKMLFRGAYDSFKNPVTGNTKKNLISYGHFANLTVEEQDVIDDIFTLSRYNGFIDNRVKGANISTKVYNHSKEVRNDIVTDIINKIYNGNFKNVEVKKSVQIIKYDNDGNAIAPKRQKVVMLKITDPVDKSTISYVYHDALGKASSIIKNTDKINYQDFYNIAVSSKNVRIDNYVKTKRQNKGIDTNKEFIPFSSNFVMNPLYMDLFSTKNIDNIKSNVFVNRDRGTGETFFGRLNSQGQVEYPNLGTSRGDSKNAMFSLSSAPEGFDKDYLTQIYKDRYGIDPTNEELMKNYTYIKCADGTTIVRGIDDPFIMYNRLNGFDTVDNLIEHGYAFRHSFAIDNQISDLSFQKTSEQSILFITSKDNGEKDKSIFDRMTLSRQDAGSSLISDTFVAVMKHEVMEEFEDIYGETIQQYFDKILYNNEERAKQISSFNQAGFLDNTVFTAEDLKAAEEASDKIMLNAGLEPFTNKEPDFYRDFGRTGLVKYLLQIPEMKQVTDLIENRLAYYMLDAEKQKIGNQFNKTQEFESILLNLINDKYPFYYHFASNFHERFNIPLLYNAPHSSRFNTRKEQLLSYIDEEYYNHNPLAAPAQFYGYGLSAELSFLQPGAGKNKLINYGHLWDVADGLSGYDHRKYYDIIKSINNAINKKISFLSRKEVDKFLSGGVINDKFIDFVSNEFKKELDVIYNNTLDFVQRQKQKLENIKKDGSNIYDFISEEAAEEFYKKKEGFIDLFQPELKKVSKEEQIASLVRDDIASNIKYYSDLSWYPFFKHYLEVEDMSFFQAMYTSFKKDDQMYGEAWAKYVTLDDIKVIYTQPENFDNLRTKLTNKGYNVYELPNTDNRNVIQEYIDKNDGEKTMFIVKDGETIQTLPNVKFSKTLDDPLDQHINEFKQEHPDALKSFIKKNWNTSDGNIFQKMRQLFIDLDSLTPSMFQKEYGFPKESLEKYKKYVTTTNPFTGEPDGNKYDVNETMFAIKNSDDIKRYIDDEEKEFIKFSEDDFERMKIELGLQDTPATKQDIIDSIIKNTLLSESEKSDPLKDVIQYHSINGLTLLRTEDEPFVVASRVNSPSVVDNLIDYDATFRSSVYIADDVSPNRLSFIDNENPNSVTLLYTSKDNFGKRDQELFERMSLYDADSGTILINNAISSVIKEEIIFELNNELQNTLGKTFYQIIQENDKAGILPYIEEYIGYDPVFISYEKNKKFYNMPKEVQDKLIDAGFLPNRSIYDINLDSRVTKATVYYSSLIPEDLKEKIKQKISEKIEHYKMQDLDMEKLNSITALDPDLTIASHNALEIMELRIQSMIFQNAPSNLYTSYYIPLVFDIDRLLKEPAKHPYKTRVQEMEDWIAKEQIKNDPARGYDYDEISEESLTTRGLNDVLSLKMINQENIEDLLYSFEYRGLDIDDMHTILDLVDMDYISYRLYMTNHKDLDMSSYINDAIERISKIYYCLDKDNKKLLNIYFDRRNLSSIEDWGWECLGEHKDLLEHFLSLDRVSQEAILYNLLRNNKDDDFFEGWLPMTRLDDIKMIHVNDKQYYENRQKKLEDKGYVVKYLHGNDTTQLQGEIDKYNSHKTIFFIDDDTLTETPNLKFSKTNNNPKPINDSIKEIDRDALMLHVQSGSEGTLKTMDNINSVIDNKIKDHYPIVKYSLDHTPEGEEKDFLLRIFRQLHGRDYNNNDGKLEEEFTYYKTSNGITIVRGVNEPFFITNTTRFDIASQLIENGALIRNSYALATKPDSVIIGEEPEDIVTFFFTSKDSMGQQDNALINNLFVGGDDIRSMLAHHTANWLMLEDVKKLFKRDFGTEPYDYMADYLSKHTDIPQFLEGANNSDLYKFFIKYKGYFEGTTNITDDIKQFLRDTFRWIYDKTGKRYPFDIFNGFEQLYRDFFDSVILPNIDPAVNDMVNKYIDNIAYVDSRDSHKNDYKRRLATNIFGKEKIFDLGFTDDLLFDTIDINKLSTMDPILGTNRIEEIENVFNSLFKQGYSPARVYSLDIAPGLGFHKDYRASSGIDVDGEKYLPLSYLVQDKKELFFGMVKHVLKASNDNKEIFLFYETLHDIINNRALTNVSSITRMFGEKDRLLDLNKFYQNIKEGVLKDIEDETTTIYKRNLGDISKKFFDKMDQASTSDMNMIIQTIAEHSQPKGLRYYEGRGSVMKLNDVKVITANNETINRIMDLKKPSNAPTFVRVPDNANIKMYIEANDGENLIFLVNRDRQGDLADVRFSKTRGDVDQETVDNIIKGLTEDRRGVKFGINKDFTTYRIANGIAGKEIKLYEITAENVETVKGRLPEGTVYVTGKDTVKQVIDLAKEGETNIAILYPRLNTAKMSDNEKDMLLKDYKRYSGNNEVLNDLLSLIKDSCDLYEGVNGEVLVKDSDSPIFVAKNTTTELLNRILKSGKDGIINFSHGISDSFPKSLFSFGPIMLLFSNKNRDVFKDFYYFEGDGFSIEPFQILRIKMLEKYGVDDIIKNYIKPQEYFSEGWLKQNLSNAKDVIMKKDFDKYFHNDDFLDFFLKTTEVMDYEKIIADNPGWFTKKGIEGFVKEWGIGEPGALTTTSGIRLIDNDKKRYVFLGDELEYYIPDEYENIVKQLGGYDWFQYKKDVNSIKEIFSGTQDYDKALQLLYILDSLSDNPKLVKGNVVDLHKVVQYINTKGFLKKIPDNIPHDFRDFDELQQEIILHEILKGQNVKIGFGQKTVFEGWKPTIQKDSLKGIVVYEEDKENVINTITKNGYKYIDIEKYMQSPALLQQRLDHLKDKTLFIYTYKGPEDEQVENLGKVLYSKTQSLPNDEMIRMMKGITDMNLRIGVDVYGMKKNINRRANVLGIKHDVNINKDLPDIHNNRLSLSNTMSYIKDINEIGEQKRDVAKKYNESINHVKTLQSSPIYKLTERVVGLVDDNPDLLNYLKRGDEQPQVTAINKRLYNDINDDGFPTVLPAGTLDKKYGYDMDTEMLVPDVEKNLITKYGNFEIIPYTKDDVGNIDFMDKGNFAIWSNDGFEFWKLKNDIAHLDTTHIKVYERKGENVVYYSKTRDVQNIEEAKQMQNAALDLFDEMTSFTLECKI